ncbi:hypothetical protein CaCOL14_007713 [Colletotrichum acutatum]|uniref:Uncharacterized protein n=1 Tax=Glomerella acutata TaxID=27357 RepID=A0AAD8XLL7_GLOAC|nr:uncharacterized protein BDZ83DRAFT_748299 [Colletotrichum acutatum]KAK1729554.1 hypothetical protein BDZ83DRAFT_748299 [Colletotrichum acutatum]
MAKTDLGARKEAVTLPPLRPPKPNLKSSFRKGPQYFASNMCWHQHGHNLGILLKHLSCNIKEEYHRFNMADTKSINGSEAAPAAGRVGAWTDAERFQLVLRVLATVLPDGKGVDWKNVNMEGRTLKALQGQWTAIIAQMREINTGENGEAAAPKQKTPRKTATKKKAAAAAEDGEEANGDQEGSEETKAVTPKKRAAATNADGTPKKRRTPAKKAAQSKAQAQAEEAQETEAEAKVEAESETQVVTKDEKDGEQ